MLMSLHAYNSNGSSRDVTSKFVRSATTYTIDTFASNVTTGQSTAITSSFQPLLKAGDKFVTNITGSGVSIYARFLLLPDTYPIDDFLATSITTGATLYTCPSGKAAFVLSNNYSATSSGSVQFYNTTGGTRAIEIFNVPSGEVQASSFRVRTSSVNNNQAQPLTVLAYMNAGDKLDYACDGPGTGGGYLYGIVVEFA